MVECDQLTADQLTADQLAADQLAEQKRATMYEGANPRFIIPLSILALLCACCAGCYPYESPQISITEPPRGAMLPAGDPVRVKVSGDSSELQGVLINGEALTPTSGAGSGEHIYTLPTRSGVGSGLGYVTASLPDDPYLVARSWLQGEVISASEWYPDTLTIRFSGDSLNGNEGSLAHLISAALSAVDLARFIPLIEIDLGISSAEIEVNSARVGDAEIKLKVEGDQLAVEVELSQVELDYRIESALLDTSGEGSYSEIKAEASAELATHGVSLTDLDVEISRLSVDDDRLPDYLVDPIIDALQGKFKDAITQAIMDATYAITSQLFNQLDPQLGLTLSRPIQQESSLVNV